MKESRSSSTVSASGGRAGRSERLLLEVGRVVKPHGLTGELVVVFVSNRPERNRPGARFVVSGSSRELTVESSRPHKNRWLIRFAGVPDRNSAELLRGAILLADPIDDPEAVWVHDLVGLAVQTVDGEFKGRVVAVQENPASDLLVLEGGELVPLTFVEEIDTSRIVVDPPPGLFDL